MTRAKKKGGKKKIGKRRAKRTTHNYTLRKTRTTVYHGISKNPKQRISQHKSSGKRFTRATVGPKVSRKTALKRERSRIQSHKKSHGGKKPKYNKR